MPLAFLSSVDFDIHHQKIPLSQQIDRVFRSPKPFNFASLHLIPELWIKKNLLERLQLLLLPSSQPQIQMFKIRLQDCTSMQLSTSRIDTQDSLALRAFSNSNSGAGCPSAVLLSSSTNGFLIEHHTVSPPSPTFFSHPRLNTILRQQ